MKLRTKLKRANKQIEILEKVIAGLKRGNRYLFGLCEKTKAEAAEKIKAAEAEKEVMLMLLAGCALAVGGEIIVHTENMGRVLEENEIEFKADFENHKATIRLKEKTEECVELAKE